MPESGQATRSKTTRFATALRLGFAVSVAAGVSACAFGSPRPSAVFDSCLSERADIVENVDWSKARHRDIRIIDGDYRPMVMSFEVDTPYILTITNADRSDHSMWAPGLLKQGVALDSVQIGDKSPAKGCVNGVRVPARSTVTIKFVPVWDGRYEAFDGQIPVYPGKLAQSVFHIVQPRLGVASN